jgi:glutathione peroxidase-family protein
MIPLNDINYLYANASFNLQDAKGNDVDLSTYKGKVLLIINVASKWYSSFA